MAINKDEDKLNAVEQVEDANAPMFTFPFLIPFDPPQVITNIFILPFPQPPNTGN